MKAEDLMIGDWVIRRGVPEEPMRLYDMKVSAGIAYLDQDGRGVTEKFGNIEPIPLTSEILEKNGIKLSSTYTHPYRDGGWEEGELEEAMKHYPMYVYQTLNPSITFVSRPDEQELTVCSSNYKTRVEKKEEVIFVHELQHALRLCEIKKEIVL